MPVSHVFSGIPTADLDAALDWYERLLGRPPDNRPHAEEAVWSLTDSALVYVVLDPQRAGQGLLTVIVDDLAAHIGGLRSRGLAVGETNTLGSGARSATLTDPDGNRITIGQV